MRQPAYGSEVLVDGAGGQTARFHMHSVTHDHDAVECEARFRAVPGRELLDGVFINPARGRRTETVEDRHFAMIEVRYPEDPATVI